jgi:sigma-E factor negative regulatory protein RseC
MYETGTVKNVTGSGVELEVTPGEQCGSCPRQGGCHSRMDLGITNQDRTIDARNDAGARVGDRVEVLIPGRRRLAAGLVVFGLPVLFGIAGAIIGSLAGSDAGTGIGLAVGLAAGFAAALLVNRLVGRRRDLLPRVVRIMKPAANESCH